MATELQKLFDKFISDLTLATRNAAHCSEFGGQGPTRRESISVDRRELVNLFKALFPASKATPEIFAEFLSDKTELTVDASMWKALLRQAEIDGKLVQQ